MNLRELILKRLRKSPASTQQLRNEEARSNKYRANPAAIEAELFRLRDANEIAYGGGVWFIRGEMPVAENKPRKEGKAPHPKQTRFDF